MKKYLTLVLFAHFIIPAKTFSQNIAVNATGNLPDTSAMLDVSSTNKGFLTPRMTTAQQNAIPLPAKGLLIFNTTDNVFKVNTGTTSSPVWTALATGNQLSLTTTGTSGAASYNSETGVLNIPAYASGSGTVTSVGLTSSDITVGGTSPITTSGTYTLTLPTVNNNAGSFTNANITVNAKGLVTAVSNGTAGSGWLLTGNAGITQPAVPVTYGSSALGASEHYLGTTDAKDLVLATNDLERMRLMKSTGYLGIGTAAPTKPIDLVKNLSGEGLMKIQNTSASGYSSIDIWSNTTQIGNIGFSNAGAVYPNAFYFATNTTNSMVFATNNSERMRIDGSTGNIGIGQTSPGAALDIKGTLRLSGSTSGFVGLRPAAAAGSVTYTLPSSDGTSGQMLVTNGSGLLSWASPSAGSSSGGWGLTGNSGTSSSNFIGTSDGQALIFKVNGTQAGYLGLSGSSFATTFGVGAGSTFKSTAIGASASASTNNEATALGYAAVAAGFRSVALGSAATTGNVNEAVAMGYNAQASTYRGIAIGSEARVNTNNDALAIGVGATSTGYQATALGYGARATGQNSTAIGNGATVSNANYISIGNTSVTAIRGQVNFTTYSDGRFKRNIKADVPGLDFITKLNRLPTPGIFINSTTTSKLVPLMQQLLATIWNRKLIFSKKKAYNTLDL